MKKQLMIPGKRYKGYAYINEFGQIHFDPSQVGSKPDAKKLVEETEDYTVYETKNYVLYHLRVIKDRTMLERLKQLLSIMNDLIRITKEYEF